MLSSPRRKGQDSLFKEVRVFKDLEAAKSMKNNLNAAIAGLFNSRRSPLEMTLTGLNLKNRKDLTVLFNQVSAPSKNSKIIQLQPH